jgi:hypothetical protein
VAINNSDKNKGKKRLNFPFYLNWRLWLAVSIGLILTTVGLVMVFGPAAIVATVAAILGGAGLLSKPIIAFGSKIFEEIKESRERAERAEEKAFIEGRRNTEIEMKADRAAGAAVVLANRVDVNTERTDLLDTRFEVLSDMAYQITETLQRERAEYRVVLAELKAQNQEQQKEINSLRENHKREIAELKEQIRLMGVEKSGDKDKIFNLETQVKQLQDRVKELEDREKQLQDRENALNQENKRLREENTGLRGNPMRRGTDQLPPLASGDMVRLERINEVEGETNK